MAKIIPYNNEEYRSLIIEFFNDSIYSSTSPGTKIQKIRQYTEIVLRRLLKYPCNKNIEIGNDQTIEKLDSAGFTEPLFRESLENIRKIGNERSHTKWRKTASDEEYQEILNCLLNVYGYLFYKFFKKWPFGTNKSILSAFSCLPPIIRHITLSALYDDEPDNPIIVDRLVLAKFKSIGRKTAEEWLETHKEQLQNLPAFEIDSDDLKQLIDVVGVEAAYNFLSNHLQNVYDACKEKIQKLDDNSYSKPMYSDFETAKSYYEKYGIAEGTSPDVVEFNDLMEFVYIGRRKNEEIIACIPENNYIINQIATDDLP